MKSFIIFIVISFLIACGAGTGETSNSDSAIGLQPIVNAGGTNIDSANEPGSRLIAANDCLTCHQISQKGFGPSYQQIANRYENNQGNVENLADKIRKGGKGLWGQNMMTPHPTVSDPQAQEMARYILSLRDTSGTTK
jgi:cytochrome c